MFYSDEFQKYYYCLTMNIITKINVFSKNNPIKIAEDPEPVNIIILNLLLKKHEILVFKLTLYSHYLSNLLQVILFLIL